MGKGSRPASLLEVLQGLIERTYRMDTGIAEIHRFVVGDRGLSRLGVGAGPVRVAASGWPEAAVLVRQGHDGIRASIYYPDSLIAALEGRNPWYGLDDRNLLPFSVFVEELDHLLTLADRARAGRGVSLLELELHANVTKYVATLHFLARSAGRPLNRGERQWLRWRLFESLEPPAEPPERRERYLEADRLGCRYAGFLDRLGAGERLRELRRFHRLSAAGVVHRLATVDGHRPVA